MIEVLVIVGTFVLFVSLSKRSKFEEMEKHQAMRRALKQAQWK